MDNTQTVIMNRYEIKRLIGRGGMGNVYLGTDRETNEPVAIKHLKAEFVSKAPDMVERFNREGEILAQLNHPNIVRIRESITENADHYIIMDYIDGGSLENLMKEQGELPLNRIMEIGLDLADALTRAHRLKVIHRDLKPANVLLKDDGTPLLTDFGVAHMGNRTRMTEVGSVIGTYAYLSPEACEGQVLDERADIWAFGVLMYEMITGQRPFAGDQPASIIRQIMTQLPRPLQELRPDVTPELATLVMWMLEKDRDARIPTVRRVGAELEALLEGLDPTARPAAKPTGAASRFATPTPSNPHDDGTILVESATPSIQDASEGRPPTEPSTARQHHNLLPWTGMTVVVLAILAVVLVVLLNNSDDTSENDSNAQREAENTPSNVSAVISIEGDPVPEGSILVMVAELDPVETEPRDLSRFILDDLQQNLTNNLPEQPIYVRPYPGILRSVAEAEAAAERNNAAIVVWGFYTDDFVQVDITAGSLQTFPYIPFTREEVISHTNIRARYNSIDDVFNQTLSYHILNAVTILHIADGNAFEVLRLSLALANISAPGVPVVGDTVAALEFRAYQSLYFEDGPQAAESFLNHLNQALQRDPNAFTFINRGSFYLSIGEVENAAQDIAAAERLAPDGWAMPLYLNAGLILTSGEVEQLLSEIIAMRPTDWYAYHNRGTYHYFERNFDRALEDFETAITYAPPANFPYVFASFIAMRDGRFTDMIELLQFVAQEFPDPNYSQRLLNTSFTAGTFKASELYISAATNLVLAQYDAAIQSVDEFIALFGSDGSGIQGHMDGLPVGELYTIKGLAHCNRGELDAAAGAYTTGIELEPEFWLLYLTRNEIYFLQERSGDAMSDVVTLLNADIHPQLYEAAEIGEAGGLTCKNFFDYEPSSRDP